MRRITTRRPSCSPRETKQQGAFFAKTLLMRRSTTPLVVALRGELGSGKTTFVQGLARELGVRRTITSPTFLIVRHYPVRRGAVKHLFHIDAYRMKNKKEVSTIGLREIFSTPRSVIVVEWPERLHTKLPRGTVRVTFRHGSHERERTLRVPSSL